MGELDDGWMDMCLLTMCLLFKLSSDREKHLMFSIFDENKSWYADENRIDPHYNSNVMHSKDHI